MTDYDNARLVSDAVNGIDETLRELVTLQTEMVKQFVEAVKTLNEIASLWRKEVV